MKNLKSIFILIGVVLISCSKDDSSESSLGNEFIELSIENDSDEDNHENENQHNSLASENEFNLVDNSCPNNDNIKKYISDNIIGSVCGIARLSELTLNAPIEYEFATNLVDNATIEWDASGGVEIISVENTDEINSTYSVTIMLSENFESGSFSVRITGFSANATNKSGPPSDACGVGITITREE